MAHDTLSNIAISVSVSTPPCSFVSVHNLTISFSTNSFFFTFVILSSISSGLIKVNVTGMSCYHSTFCSLNTSALLLTQATSFGLDEQTPLVDSIGYSTQQFF